MGSSRDKTVTIILFIVFVVVAGISLALAFFLTNRDLRTEDSDASTGELPIIAPRELTLSNVTATSATISWYTDVEASSYIEFGTSPENKTSVARDFRDTEASETRKLHYIRLTGLRESTDYYFDIYSNGQVVESAALSEFSTFPTSENLVTPETVLISAPSEFAEGGIFYAHVKNDTEISSTISTLATTDRVSITISNAKDTSTGEAFDLTDSYVLVSATNESGTRSREVFATSDIDETIQLDPALETTEIYASGEDFVIPSDVVAQDPVVPTPEPEPEPEPEPNPAPAPTPTPPNTPTVPAESPASPPTNNPNVGGTNTANLPETAIEPKLLLSILSQAGAIGLVVLGFSLLFKR